MKWYKWICQPIIGICIVGSSGFANSQEPQLSLSQVEKIALDQSPELKLNQANQESYREASIAAGQLPDPKLMLSAMNLPTDTFSLNQESMTQMQIGLQQTFPRGRSLGYQSKQKRDLAEVEHERGFLLRANILRSVRLAWLDHYYWLQTKRLLEEQGAIFQHLLEVLQSLLANNKAQQKDVIRAQLELSDLENRLILVDQQLGVTRAQVARWIGADLAKQVNPAALPKWPKPSEVSLLQKQLLEHPELKVDSANTAVSHTGIALAKQQYWPGFTTGIAYGYREGRDTKGDKRPDLLTARVTMDLPLFPGKRQDRQLQASKASFIASLENQEVRYRQLQEALTMQYVAWIKLQKSVSLYKNQLNSEAKQYAEATLIAYQNNQTDFPTLARSYIRDLETQLAGLKAEVGREKAHANLLYLQGK